MNRRSRLTSVLLDKSVVRETLRALQRLESGQPLPERQFFSFDYALKDRFERQFPHISGRFKRMTHQLSLPYREATLPDVLRPDELLDLLHG